MTDQPGVNIPQLQLGQVSSTFIKPCLDCGTTVQVKDAREQPHEHRVFHKDDSPLAYAWWEGYDAARAPRIITTVEELTQLHSLSVVLYDDTANGGPIQSYVVPDDGTVCFRSPDVFHFNDFGEHYIYAKDMPLPVTVMRDGHDGN